MAQETLLELGLVAGSSRARANEKNARNFLSLSLFLVSLLIEHRLTCIQPGS